MLAAPRTIDCSGLALSSCPASENLGAKYPKETLQLYDPDDKSSVVGCYSPCAKLTYSQWSQASAHALRVGSDEGSFTRATRSHHRSDPAGPTRQLTPSHRHAMAGPQ